jgi:hypothetical protein
MAVKSKAQRRKFADAGNKQLPERVGKTKKGKKKARTKKAGRKS